MSRYLKKYTMFLLCASLLNITLFSHARPTIKQSIPSRDETAQTTENNDQPEEIKKKKPTVRESWHKVVTLRWRELSKTDMWNIVTPIAGIAVLGLLYYHHSKSIIIGNDNHNPGQDNPDNNNPGNNNLDQKKPDNNNHGQVIKHKLLTQEQRTKIARLANEDETFVPDVEHKIALDIVEDFLIKPTQFQGTNNVQCVTINNDKLIICSNNNTAEIWNIHTNQLLYTLQGHIQQIISLATKDDKVVTGSHDRTAKIWDINNGTLLHSLQGDAAIYSVAISGDKVVTASYLGTISIWNINSGKLLHSFDGGSGNFGLNHKLTSVAISGNKVVTGADDSIAQVWNTDTGELEYTLKGTTDSFLSRIMNRARTHNTCAVAISGNKVITGSDDGTVRIWDIEEGQLEHTLAAHKQRICSIAINDNNVVTTSTNDNIKIWNIHTGQLLRTLKKPHNNGTAYAYSAAISDDKIVVASNFCWDNGTTYVYQGNHAYRGNPVYIWPLSADLDTQEFNTPGQALTWIKHNLLPLQANLIARANTANKADGIFIIKSDTDDARIWITFPAHVRNYLMGQLNIQLRR